MYKNVLTFFILTTVFYFKNVRKWNRPTHNQIKIKMTFCFVMQYNLQQHVLQFGCNSLRAFTRAAVPRRYGIMSISQVSSVDRHLGNSASRRAAQLITSMSHIFQLQA